MKNTLKISLEWNKPYFLRPNDNQVVYIITTSNIVYTACYYGDENEFRIFTNKPETNFSLPLSKVRGWIATNLSIQCENCEECN